MGNQIQSVHPTNEDTGSYPSASNISQSLFFLRSTESNLKESLQRLSALAPINVNSIISSKTSNPFQHSGAVFFIGLDRVGKSTLIDMLCRTKSLKYSNSRVSTLSRRPSRAQTPKDSLSSSPVESIQHIRLDKQIPGSSSAISSGETSRDESNPKILKKSNSYSRLLTYQNNYLHPRTILPRYTYYYLEDQRKLSNYQSRFSEENESGYMSTPSINSIFLFIDLPWSYISTPSSASQDRLSLSFTFSEVKPRVIYYVIDSSDAYRLPLVALQLIEMNNYFSKHSHGMNNSALSNKSTEDQESRYNTSVILIATKTDIQGSLKGKVILHKLLSYISLILRQRKLNLPKRRVYHDSCEYNLRSQSIRSSFFYVQNNQCNSEELKPFSEGLSTTLSIAAKLGKYLNHIKTKSQNGNTRHSTSRKSINEMRHKDASSSESIQENITHRRQMPTLYSKISDSIPFYVMSSLLPSVIENQPSTSYDQSYFPRHNLHLPSEKIRPHDRSEARVLSASRQTEVKIIANADISIDEFTLISINTTILEVNTRSTESIEQLKTFISNQLREHVTKR